MTDALEIGPDDDLEEVLQRLLDGILSGQIKALTLRVNHTDGTTHTIQWGYEDEADRDGALARLLKELGELH